MKRERNQTNEVLFEFPYQEARHAITVNGSTAEVARYSKIPIKCLDSFMLIIVNKKI